MSSQLLLDWYTEELGRIYSSSSARPGQLLIGTQIWGEKYLDRFARYLVPSMLAPENIGTLAGQSRFLIYTDHLHDVWRICRPLEACSVEIEIHPLPSSKCLQERSNYILGAIHCAMMGASAHWAMPLHVTYADHLFSDRFFPNLFRIAEQHPNIAQYQITGQLETASLELESYRDQGILKIPAVNLGTIAYKHHHQQQKPFVMNDLEPGRMAPTPFLVWRLEDRLAIHCVHMNPELISWTECASIQAPNKNTIVAPLDTRLPYVFRTFPYIPKLEDELTVIEFSDSSKPARSDSSWEEFADLAWHVMRFGDDYLPYLSARSVLPLAKGHGLGKPISDREANGQLDGIIGLLYDERASYAVASIQERSRELGWIPAGTTYTPGPLRRAQTNAALKPKE